ncbi:MAG: hypothetical protein L0Y66_15130 [Myxococcaceae bacterium]|nr:hypothetical protein [Myxococcaceae bacterium]MCI0671404.1 hypothetical protein [Myxococcaceae bacterium]
MRRDEVWCTRFGGRHAVVVGGGLAGLLSARVLANHFARVTVLERDVLGSPSDVPAAVPHAKHGHVLLAESLRVLSWLFPALTEDLLAHGAQELDSAQDTRKHQGGVWKRRAPNGSKRVGLSRPLLEWRVRAHLLERRNVRIVDGATAVGLLASGEGARIGGVEVEHEGSIKRVDADLVVDAGGRDSRLPAWLEGLGFGAPAVTEVRHDAVDATATSRRRHYEQMERLPEGLAVVGDSACCMSSRVSQGMTEAALSAEVLDTALRLQARTPGDIRGLTMLFQQQLARTMDLPWKAALRELRPRTALFSPRAMLRALTAAGEPAPARAG